MYSIMREMDWASVITCFWYRIHSSAQSHIHKNISLNVHWGHTVLSFHPLRVISDDGTAQCICSLHLTGFVESKNNLLVYKSLSILKVFTAVIYLWLRQSPESENKELWSIHGGNSSPSAKSLNLIG